MYIHLFGAYFGLVVTRFLTTKEAHMHPDNCSCYSSDLFSFAGTLFLWIMWPSFNAAIASPGVPQVYIIILYFYFEFIFLLEVKLLRFLNLLIIL
jgi:ammonium transporter Rh